MISTAWSSSESSASWSTHDTVARTYRARACRRVVESRVQVASIKGSHHLLRHPDGRTTTVPVHAGETTGPGLLAKILRDSELTREQLREYL